MPRRGTPEEAAAAGANQAPDVDDNDVSVPVFVDEEAGLKNLECLLKDVLSDRESLTMTQLYQLSDEKRLDVARACAGIAHGLLDDTTSHKTRGTGAAANAPRALEWVRDALHIVPGDIAAEKPAFFLFLKAWALDQMEYLAAAQACYERVEAKSLPKKLEIKLKENLVSLQTRLNKAKTNPVLYNKGKPNCQTKLDGTSPIKGLPRVTERWCKRTWNIYIYIYIYPCIFI
jgi:hypothetical protein